MALYLSLQVLAWIALAISDLPPWAIGLGLCFCCCHALLSGPRDLFLTSPAAFTGLRHDGENWQLWSAREGWVSVRLRPDSLALPVAVVLRFQLEGQRRVRGLCVASDALEPREHRRLRVRLRFSRRRWAVSG
nr:protein YgfX [Pseudomonas sp. RIT-PI-AD]